MTITDRRNSMDDKLLKTGPTSGLRAVAWVDLIGSIITAIVLWATSVTSSSVALGFGILFQGIVACVLFLVIASMADNLGAIRKNTEFLNLTESGRKRTPVATESNLSDNIQPLSQPLTRLETSPDTVSFIDFNDTLTP
jgi:hypothetical protein